LSDWDPATEAEAAMRDALLASDQEHYFRILARSELLLPVSAEALAGRAPMGWGTWTTGNRTHVLAFTSPGALFTCLNDPSGSYRTVPFHALAGDWPNYEWWLAVNPGLPIEAYLPSWFVAQLTRGEVRLPGRTMGARARMAQSDLATALTGRVRAAGPPPAQAAQASAAVPVSPLPPRPGGPVSMNGRGHPVVETVDAEIIDYPPAAGSARVYGRGDMWPEAGPGPGGVAFAPDPPTRPIPRPAPAPAAAPAAGPPVRETMDAEVVAPPEAWAAGFVPANETETNLLAAVEENNTDAFLSTLLLARVILPVPPGTPSSVRPRHPDFPWHVEQKDGQPFVSVFTSPERMADHGRLRDGSSVSLRFVELIAAWPGEGVSFAINPGTPVGATLPGSQIVALASWATEVGLRDEPGTDVALAAKKNESAPVVGVAGAPTVTADRATVMQRTVPPAQLPFYLERGYDRVSGFVNRASEVSHLTTPRSLYRALGLVYPGSPFADDDAEVHVVRWVAHRTDLYRLPYGGQHEAGMRAMQGWVIERPPFRGNGFAPGDSEVVAEFKVDSVRLPHGAQMWRLAKDGTETLVATFDADTSRWLPAGGAYA
jgi:hypothetical protein